MIPEKLLERIRENLVSAEKGPYCLDLVINDFCTLNCRYCYGHTQERKSLLTREQLTRILDAAEKMSVAEISLTSLVGEPTAFAHIRFLMEEIKKRGFFGSLLTNGSLLDPGFGRFLKEIGWNVLILSLDSFRPEIQYELRPGRNGNGYLENIAGFLKYASVEYPGMDILLNMVVTSRNYRDVREYFARAEGYRVRRITLLKLMKMNDAYAGLRLSQGQEDEFKEMLRGIETKIGFNRLEWLSEEGPSLPERPRLDGGLSLPERPRCYFHLYKMLIDNCGQVLKCNGDAAKTGISALEGDLSQIYTRVRNMYKPMLYDPPCWESCCSPIKMLNQEIGEALKERHG